MVKVLVSACLIGAPVRYNGKDKRCSHPVLDRWLQEGRIVSICPEVLGGLGTPRPPAEIVQISGLRRVVTDCGHDVTMEFERGAALALEQGERNDACVAVLKEGSPSCGPGWIYDGTFTGTRAPGQGVTAALLRARGIRVFSEEQLDAADALILQMEGRG